MIVIFKAATANSLSPGTYDSGEALYMPVLFTVIKYEQDIRNLRSTAILTFTFPMLLFYRFELLAEIGDYLKIM